MKALKIILIVLVVIVGGFFIWMTTIPGEYHVERSTVIEADQELVYNYVSDFQTWPEWSSWFEMDPNAEVTYGEITSGEGASYAWQGEKMGKGKQSITEAVPNESLKTNIQFEGMGEADGYWTFEPTEEGKTKVTWGFGGELPIYARFMKYGIEKQTAPDFEKGLAKMKEKIESMPAEEPEVEIAMVDVEPRPYFGIKHDISWSELNTEFFKENYETISTYIGEDAIEGPAFAIFHVWDETNKRTVVEPAFYSSSDKAGNDQIKKGMTNGGKAMKAVHVGGWDTEAEHMALSEYAEKNNFQIAGGVWEVYVSNPEEEPDTSKWVTEIYYPVKASN